MESASCTLNMPLVKIWFAIRPQHFLLSPGPRSLVSQVMSVVFGAGAWLQTWSWRAGQCLWSNVFPTLISASSFINIGPTQAAPECCCRWACETLRMSAPGQAGPNGSSCCCDWITLTGICKSMSSSLGIFTNVVMYLTRHHVLHSWPPFCHQQGRENVKNLGLEAWNAFFWPVIKGRKPESSQPGLTAKNGNQAFTFFTQVPFLPQIIATLPKAHNQNTYTWKMAWSMLALAEPELQMVVNTRRKQTCCEFDKPSLTEKEPGENHVQNWFHFHCYPLGNSCWFLLNGLNVSKLGL